MDYQNPPKPNSFANLNTLADTRCRKSHPFLIKHSEANKQLVSQAVHNLSDTFQTRNNRRDQKRYSRAKPTLTWPGVTEFIKGLLVFLTGVR